MGDANQEANAGYNQEASADHEQEDQIEAEQGINKFPIMDTIAGILEDDRYNWRQQARVKKPL